MMRLPEALNRWLGPVLAGLLLLGSLWALASRLGIGRSEADRAVEAARGLWHAQVAWRAEGGAWLTDADLPSDGTASLRSLLGDAGWEGSRLLEWSGHWVAILPRSEGAFIAIGGDDLKVYIKETGGVPQQLSEQSSWRLIHASEPTRVFRRSSP